MTEDLDKGSDIEEMGPGDVPEPGPDEPELIGDDVTRADEAGSGEAREADEAGENALGPRHTLRQVAAETVAKAVGVAVELGSVLGGQGGEIVSAERDVAEAETEDLIDGEEDEGQRED